MSESLRKLTLILTVIKAGIDSTSMPLAIDPITIVYAALVSIYIAASTIRLVVAPPPLKYRARNIRAQAIAFARPSHQYYFAGVYGAVG